MRFYRPRRKSKPTPTRAEQWLNKIQAYGPIAAIIVIIGAVASVLHVPAGIVDDIKKIREFRPEPDQKEQRAILAAFNAGEETDLFIALNTDYKNFEANRESAFNHGKIGYVMTDKDVDAERRLPPLRDQLIANLKAVDVAADEEFLDSQDFARWYPYPGGVSAIADLIKVKVGTKASTAYLLAYDIKTMLTRFDPPLSITSSASFERESDEDLAFAAQQVEAEMAKKASELDLPAPNFSHFKPGRGVTRTTVMWAYYMDTKQRLKEKVK